MRNAGASRLPPLMAWPGFRGDRSGDRAAASPRTAHGAWTDAAVLVAATLLLRMLWIGTESFWGDELFTWHWIQQDQSFLWGEGRRLDTNPPLYYSLVAGWRQIFGSDEIGLRSLSALTSALWVGVCYATGRILLGRTAALIGGACLMVLPFAWNYGQDARPVALLPLTEGLMLLGMALYLKRADEAGSPRAWRAAVLPGTLYCIGAVSALYTHATAMLFFAATGLTMAAACLVQPRLGRRALLAWAAFGALSTALAAPQILEFLFKPYSATQSVPPLSLLVIGTFFSEIAAGRAMELVAQEPKGIAVVLAGTVYALALFGALRLLARGPSAVPARWVILVAPAGFVALLLGVSVARPLLVPRYALVLDMPVALLLGAAAAQAGRRPALRVAMAALVLGLPGALSARERFLPLREDWRAVVRAYAADPICRDAPVIAPFQFASLGWPYYATAGMAVPPSRRFISSDAGGNVDGAGYIPSSAVEEALSTHGPIALVYKSGRAPELEKLLLAQDGVTVLHRFTGVELRCRGRH